MRDLIRHRLRASPRTFAGMPQMSGCSLGASRRVAGPRNTDVLCSRESGTHQYESILPSRDLMPIVENLGDLAYIGS